MARSVDEATGHGKATLNGGMAPSSSSSRRKKRKAEPYLGPAQRR